MALLNNLGGASVLEMSVLAAELVAFRVGDRIDRMVGPVAMKTSLAMRGFSVSVVRIGAEDAELLARPCAMPAWPGCTMLAAQVILPLPDGLAPIRAMPSAYPGTRAFLTRCCDILIAAGDALNALDARSGDGDTGSTLARASRTLPGDGHAAPRRPHAALSRHRTGVEAGHGRLVGPAAGTLRCGGRRCRLLGACRCDSR